MARNRALPPSRTPSSQGHSRAAKTSGSGLAVARPDHHQVVAQAIERAHQRLRVGESVR